MVHACLLFEDKKTCILIDFFINAVPDIYRGTEAQVILLSIVIFDATISILPVGRLGFTVSGVLSLILPLCILHTHFFRCRQVQRFQSITDESKTA
jgi:hypothetical protein